MGGRGEGLEGGVRGWEGGVSGGPANRGRHANNAICSLSPLVKAKELSPWNWRSWSVDVLSPRANTTCTGEQHTSQLYTANVYFIARCQAVVKIYRYLYLSYRTCSCMG